MAHPGASRGRVNLALSAPHDFEMTSNLEAN